MSKPETRERAGAPHDTSRPEGAGHRSAGRPEDTKPPRGWRRLLWLGPGFLWMVSAAGSGELLFTPRVGALYGYTLLWALFAAVALKWAINREIGRYTVVSGRRLLEGMADLPGPRGWALWILLVPQLVVAVATIAGLAGGAATALILVLPGPLWAWTVIVIIAAAALVYWGRYRGVERAAVVLGIALAVAAVAAAVTVGPDYGAMAEGTVPAPPDADLTEVLPWLGFMLSGAAGLVWYSYWLHAKGYAAAAIARSAKQGADPSRQEAADPGQDSIEEAAHEERLRGWLRQMTLDNTVAVVGVLLVAVAFLVLGAEILRPAGEAPEGNDVAPILGRLLGDVWGPVGFWFMVLAVFVGFWTTVLSDQDGWGRMYANGLRRLLGRSRLDRLGPWGEEERLRRIFVAVLVTVLPILLFLSLGEPVALLKVAGTVEAIHIPIVAALTLFLNRRLPKALQASRAMQAFAWLAVAFFTAFAALFLLQVSGVWP